MSTIHLTITPEMEDVMVTLEQMYRTMTREELLKMGLSEILQRSSMTFKQSMKKNLSLNYYYDQKSEEFFILPPKRSSRATTRLITPRFRRKKD